MAVVINLSDPGAVPGDSTSSEGRRPTPEDGFAAAACHLSFVLRLRGRNRIDEGVKGVLLPGMVPPLSGQIHSCQRQLCSGCSGRV